MKIRFVLVTFFIFIAGCQVNHTIPVSPANSSANTQTAQISPYQTANPFSMAAENFCRSRGFKQKTPSYEECILIFSRNKESAVS